MAGGGEVARKGAEKGSEMHVDCFVENWPEECSEGQRSVWAHKSPSLGVGRAVTEQPKATGG